MTANQFSGSTSRDPLTIPGLNSVLNVEALVGAGEYPFRGLLRNCEYFAKFRCKLYQRHVTWPHLSSRGTSGKCDRESAFKYIL